MFFFFLALTAGEFEKFICKESEAWEFMMSWKKNKFIIKYLFFIWFEESSVSRLFKSVKQIILVYIE